MFAEQYDREETSIPPAGDSSGFVTVEKHSPGFIAFMQQHGGGMFDRGAYRLQTLSEILHGNDMVCEAFPQYRDKVVCFGFDWLGRCFALDATRQRDGELLVVLLEPGTGEALKAPVTFSEFHDVELIEYPNESLATDFFESYLTKGGAPPRRNECIGYQKPLFLGGGDTVDNLQKCDLRVYWSVNAQLLANLRTHPNDNQPGGDA